MFAFHNGKVTFTFRVREVITAIKYDRRLHRAIMKDFQGLNCELKGLQVLKVEDFEGFFQACLNSANQDQSPARTLCKPD